MPWVKSGEGSLVSFDCDSCDEGVDCDVATIRATAQPEPHVSDFCMCWRYLQGIGWRSFKRHGRDWTYHCVKCGPQAEITHRDYLNSERQRDRIKARNAA